MAGAAVASLENQLAVYRLEVEQPRTDRAPATKPHDSEWIEPLLQQHSTWFCGLRWIVAGVLAAAGLSGFLPGVLDQLGLIIPPFWPLLAAALLAGLNLVFIRLAARQNATPKGLLWAQIVSDLLVLTAVIHWLGHGFPAAPFMYLFHIILACIVFSPGESLCVAGLAAVFYLTSLALESWGVVQPSSVLAPTWPVEPALPNLATLALRVIPMLLIWAVIWYLVSRLASALRARDRELFMTNRRLKASIEERSKHMLQTTHQLKAPFAAIHALTQILLGDYCGVLPGPARTVVEKISQRCLTLARQIQEMLQLANLRSQGQTTPPLVEVDLEHTVQEVIARVEPAARQRGIRFEQALQPAKVSAVADHLTMLVDNLLVNAVNYSYENGIVQVTCRPEQDGAVLIVRDHGIGIPKEKLPRIFDDYYQTEEAVQHNRSSTGLGLAIVRQVACEGGVPVQVESSPGWGTRFTLRFPVPGRDSNPLSPTP